MALVDVLPRVTPLHYAWNDAFRFAVMRDERLIERGAFRVMDRRRVSVIHQYYARNEGELWAILGLIAIDDDGWRLVRTEK